VKRLFAGLILALLLGSPAVAHAGQGPGYGGDADSLEVSWQKQENQALAAAPPPVPTDSNAGADSGPVRDPQRIATNAVASSSLLIDGIGFRGLSEVVIQFGSEDPVAVRADQTGTIEATFPATEASAPGTTVVAIGRSPSGATRTLVGSVPPLPHGTNLMGMVVWVVVAPIALVAVAGLLRRVPRHQGDTEVPSQLLAPPPTGPMVAGQSLSAPTGAPVAPPGPSGRGPVVRSAPVGARPARRL
jgi:hypothetical protein